MELATELSPLLYIVLSIVCSVTAYGLFKRAFRQFYTEMSPIRHNWGSELFCIIGSLFGPVSLIAAIVVNLAEGCKLGLCFRMPKELCESR